jgi:hypothetical protein
MEQAEKMRGERRLVGFDVNSPSGRREVVPVKQHRGKTRNQAIRDIPRGRLVIRKWGTDPLILVMAVGDDPEMVERLVDDICAAVAAE